MNESNRLAKSHLKRNFEDYKKKTKEQLLGSLKNFWISYRKLEDKYIAVVLDNEYHERRIKQLEKKLKIRKT